MLVKGITNTEILIKKTPKKNSMKIVIDNVVFDYNIGCRILKLKYETSPFPDLEDIWDDIVPMTFVDIAIELTNIEQRRVGINHLGLERLKDEVSPTLVSSQSLEKETMWVNSEGELVVKNYTDIYELYKVDGTKWATGVAGRGGNLVVDVFYVKCKDTSTNREYFIWIDPMSVQRTNDKNDSPRFGRSLLPDIEKHINPIQCIAWTIQTDIEKGGIEYLIRQGDCILIKTKPKFQKGEVRHLTEVEYRELLRFES